MRTKSIAIGFLALAAAFAQSAIAQDGLALLKRDTGTWDCEVKVFADPTAAPAVSKGVETNFMIGDHWLIGHFKGSIMGMDFQGASQTTYYEKAKKYVGNWVDSMSPFAMKTEGTWDEKTQTLTTIGTGKDPSGAEMKTKMTTVYNKEARIFTMYQNLGGQEVKMMEIKYTKQAETKAK